MDIDFSLPRKPRRQDARLEKTLRIFNLMHSLQRQRFKVFKPAWRAVRHAPLGLGPDILSWIKFWRILRKPLHMKSLKTLRELLNRFSAMNKRSIPQQNQRASEMAKKLLQEQSRIPRLDIPCLKREVKSIMSASRRNRKSRENREPFPPVEMLNHRRLSPGCPSPANRRNEHKPALIQKRQMGPKSVSFFLWPAIASSANPRLPLRPSLALAAPASGNSSPIPSKPARYGWDDNESQIPFESLRLPDALSKDWWNSQKPWVPRAEARQACASERRRAWAVAPRSSWPRAPWLLFSDTLVATELWSLWRNLPGWPQPPLSCPDRATGWLCGGGSPAAQGFLEVSCHPV